MTPRQFVKLFACMPECALSFLRFGVGFQLNVGWSVVYGLIGDDKEIWGLTAAEAREISRFILALRAGHPRLELLKSVAAILDGQADVVEKNNREKTIAPEFISSVLPWGRA
jgi:hypothetical protein